MTCSEALESVILEWQFWVQLHNPHRPKSDLRFSGRHYAVFMPEGLYAAALRYRNKVIKKISNRSQESGY